MFSELKRLIKALIDAVKYFKNQDHFSMEAALLSRCIYRMKMKFRSDKGLKAMEKMNRCLRQYLHVDIDKVISNFYESLPKKNDRSVYLPTRGMLEHVLVRLQGVSQLLNRLVVTALIAANSMGNKIQMGHCWKLAFLIFSLVSRIWFIAKDILKYCCKFYEVVLDFRFVFEDVGKPWLPSEYKFPSNLEKWLNVSAENIMPKPPQPLNLSTFLDENDSDVEPNDGSVNNDDVLIIKTCSQIAKSSKDKNGSKNNNFTSSKMKQSLLQNAEQKVHLKLHNDNFINLLKNTDIGEVVQREEIVNDSKDKNTNENDINNFGKQRKRKRGDKKNNAKQEDSIHNAVNDDIVHKSDDVEITVNRKRKRRRKNKNIDFPRAQNKDKY